MITKGKIISIDYSGNTCMVELPTFKGAGGGDLNVVSAIFVADPGFIQGYTVGDVVEIGFEEDRLNKAVVLGKVYLGAVTESKNISGNFYGKTLKITSFAELPGTTKVVRDSVENVGASTYGAITINELINKLELVISKNEALETRVKELEDKLKTE